MSQARGFLCNLGTFMNLLTGEVFSFDPGDALLLESGDFFLLESGDKLLLEPQ